MAHRAIVVGCDAYPELNGGELSGAVADAMAVRDWLLGGGAYARVAPERLTFLVSVSESGARPPGGIVTGRASRKEFAAAVSAAVADQDAGERDRLYVYLAGHGFGTDPNNPALSNDAFAFADFSRDDPGSNAVAVPDLVKRLSQSWFGDLVVILDACRNFPFTAAFQPAGLGFDPERPAGRGYEPRLHLLQSTLIGRVAAGTRSADTGQVRGDFTTALLSGLAGDGAAKTFDESEARYVVRWSDLTAYVEAAVPRQRPRGTGQGDLILATFPDGYFNPVTLTVAVNPEEVGQASDLTVKISYVDPARYDDPTEEAVGPVPVTFCVPPRRQRVHARSGDSWGKKSFDVYADAAVIVPVERGGPPRVGFEDAVIFRGVLGPVGRGGHVGELMVRPADPAAVVRILDGGGRNVLSSVGPLSGRLPPGSYTALLVGAGGRRHTEPAEVEAGTVTILELPGWADPGWAAGPAGRFGAEPPGELRRASPNAALAWLVRSGRFPLPRGLTHLVPGTFPLAIAGRWDPPELHGVRSRDAGFTAGRPKTGPSTSLVAEELLADIDLLPAAGWTPPDGGSWWGAVVPDTAGRGWPAVGQVRGYPGAGQVPDTAGDRPARERGGWITVRLGDHTLTVPRLPGASTVVALGDKTTVAVYDQAVLDSPRHLALLDRAQQLLAAGDRESAAEVLAVLGEARQAGYAAAALARAAGGQSAWHGLAAAVTPADAAGLLGDGPWAAFVDRPPGLPPASGELAPVPG
ncbi:MAG TPA: caspase family protein [Trebonia sp.]